MKFARALLFVLALFGFVGPANAAIITWSTTLTGGQENPPNATSATGFGTVTFDDTTNILTLELSWSGLSGPGTQAHIHCCTSPDLNAGIAIDLWLTSDPAQPATGTFSRVFDLDVDNPFRATFVATQGGMVSSAFAALRAAMDTQFAYYNIHTALRPGGEIRGNLAPVPEPTTLLLLGIGIGALGYRRARP